ncbi:MAG TPA: prephenate dehydrogenase/arogenate dehydrogenase family protein [Pirellulales bacterium]|jgi:prephenate dehydrogenase|nr:prephenate dehydrogenase/arogenate dehydrogenase family protein [Pirellulales bacterium]
MPRWNTVAIVGVGLIGGSIGLALRSRGLAGRVIGVGRSDASLGRALETGAVSETTLELAAAVEKADLVVFATPVDRIVSAIQEAQRHFSSRALVTDAGSTKAAMVRELENSIRPHIRFVGGHPLAGGEKAGVAFASADLFEGRVAIVTPIEQTPPKVVRDAREFWSSLGARVVTMSPEEHDEAVAAISHLPHLVASAVARSTPQDRLDLAAGGWRDTTRIAAGDAELWQQILLANRRNVLKSLARFEKTIARFKAALKNDKPAALKRLLAEAKRIRDAVGS